MCWRHPINAWKTTDEAIMSNHNVGHSIMSDRALSGGLVLPGWAGITVQNIPNGVAGTQLLVGVYLRPHVHCEDVVNDMFQYEFNIYYQFLCQNSVEMDHRYGSEQ